ncbi:MAG TPA: TRAP transporter small permease subunit [Aquabacterium sp.]|nr:TRAP transporter small permease subunit [Aquabacterium sp.]
MLFYIRLMDGLSRLLGVAASWALLLACLLSAGNALLRYSFNLGSNAWLEAQWYLFGVAVFAGAPMLLKLNEHVRVDVVYGGLSPRAKAWVDAIGLALVLLPVCVIVVHLSIPSVLDSYHQQEHSPSAGGLLRWPIKAAIPGGFALLALQGVSELFKRLILIGGGPDLNPQYERPLQ